MENKEIGQVFIGGILGATLDIGMETVWASNKEYWAGRFPFIGLLGDKIPPLDDLLVFGIPATIALVAHKKKRNTIRNLAIGAATYGAGMLLRHTVIRWTGYTYSKQTPITLTVPLIKEI